MLDSPFDYADQALLYIPKKLPDPNSEEPYARGRRGFAAGDPGERRKRLSPVSRLCAPMRLAHELLREEFRRRALGFPLMLQGEGLSQ